ncbi:MAG TPA: uroporphyrinogen decarboxylase family protein [Ignavibacteria bacterium]
MLNIDFKSHNLEVKEMWECFNSGNPYRIPIIFGINPRIILLNPELNKKKLTFKEYFTQPEIAFNIQLEFQYYVRHNIIQDVELGIPEEGWDLFIDLQNVYEAVWLGAPIEYYDDQVPDTKPILTDDKKYKLFDKGLPDPFSGILESHLKTWEYFLEKKKSYTFMGKPIKSVVSWIEFTDGPFTLASNLRGATEILTDLYEDPDYVHQLMDFLSDSIIYRLRAWWKVLGKPPLAPMFKLADDSIQNISTDMYKEFVLPYHKKIFNELAGKGPHFIHLCGNALRHFVTIQKELNVNVFDTGFPIDFKLMRELLGKDALIYGGPNIQLLVNGKSEDVYKETERILTSGILEGGKFILREGNNLAPQTPMENIEAMYKAGRDFGRIH